MSKEIPFNMNYMVKVKLTEAGLNIIKEKERKLRETFHDYVYPLKTDSEGYSEFVMWDLAYTFGDQLWMGNTKIPFNMNAILVPEN